MKKRKVQPRIKRETFYAVMLGDTVLLDMKGDALAIYDKSESAELRAKQSALNGPVRVAEVVLVRAPKRRKGAK